MRRVVKAFAVVTLILWAASWVLDAVFQATGGHYHVPSTIPLIAVAMSAFLFRTAGDRHDD